MLLNGRFTLRRLHSYSDRTRLERGSALTNRVNIGEVKTHLSRFVRALERGVETEIIITRNGKPAARLVPIEAAPKNRRLGLLSGQFPMMTQEEFDADNEEIWALFEDGPIFPDEPA
jgi:prevent-host-death family protein